MALGDKWFDFSDDVGLKMILKASEKKKRLNALLEEQNADVRVTSFDVQAGVPPSVSLSGSTTDTSEDPPPYSKEGTQPSLSRVAETTAT